MPSVKSNTPHQCTQCGVIVDTQDVRLLQAEGCPKCGNRRFVGLPVVFVCDFCSINIEDEAWTYPCADFMYDMIVLDGYGSQSGGSRGAWSACPECHRLLGDGPESSTEGIEAVLKRNIDLEMKRHPDQAAYRHLAYAMTKAIHKGFHEHRTGPPYREDLDELRQQ